MEHYISDRMFDFADWYDYIADIMPQESELVECGVADGCSALYLARKLLDKGKQFKLYMIDNMDYGQYNQMATIYKNIYYRGLFENVEVVPLDSVSAAKSFNGNTLDFVFLDSSHEETETKKEILVWYDKLKEEGILSGHDYFSIENPGVKKAVDELLPKMITRETIDNQEAEHYQEFEPEQLLYTKQTTKDCGIWYVRKRFYWQPK